MGEAEDAAEEPVAAEEAELAEAETRVQAEAHAIPTCPPPRRATFTGSTGKEPGIVQIGMDVLGETMKVQNLDTTETLQQQKKQIENLTNSTQVLTHLIPYTETRK